MNKNELWKVIEPLLNKANEDEIGIAFSTFGYIDKNTQEMIEIDYSQWGLDFKALVSLFEELDKDGLIDFVDTNNMGYLIYKK